MKHRTPANPPQLPKNVPQSWPFNINTEIDSHDPKKVRQFYPPAKYTDSKPLLHQIPRQYVPLHSRLVFHCESPPPRIGKCLYSASCLRGCISDDNPRDAANRHRLSPGGRHGIRQTVGYRGGGELPGPYGKEPGVQMNVIRDEIKNSIVYPLVEH